MHCRGAATLFICTQYYPHQHPPLLMSMLDVDVNALDLLWESTYLRRYPKKVWIWCYYVTFFDHWDPFLSSNPFHLSSCATFVIMWKVKFSVCSCILSLSSNANFSPFFFLFFLLSFSRMNHHHRRRRRCEPSNLRGQLDLLRSLQSMFHISMTVCFLAPIHQLQKMLKNGLCWKHFTPSRTKVHMTMSSHTCWIWYLLLVVNLTRRWRLLMLIVAIT